MLNERTSFGDKIEAELYRQGKLVPDKARSQLLIVRSARGIMVIELKPKEKHDEE